MMKKLKIKETQLVSGGTIYSLLLDIPLISVGAYFGSYLAYIQPLMTYEMTVGPMGMVETFSPNTMILICGVMLGASIGYAISEAIQILEEQKLASV